MSPLYDRLNFLLHTVVRSCGPLIGVAARSVIPAKDRMLFEARKAAPLKSIGSPNLGPSAFSLATGMASLTQARDVDAASSLRSIPPLSLPSQCDGVVVPSWRSLLHCVTAVSPSSVCCTGAGHANRCIGSWESHRFVFSLVPLLDVFPSSVVTSMMSLP
jgi:hypothetical protein